MVWETVLPIFLQLFHGIIQKEINQNGIELGLWVCLLNLPLDQFHTPDAAGYGLGS
jgi:hypothetical protein